MQACTAWRGMGLNRMVFKSFMDQALAEARAAAERGEVPVGAVIVDPNGSVVASAGNRTRELSDPSAHAEMLALRAACAASGTQRLPNHDLYVTLEPCAMCAGVIAASTSACDASISRRRSNQA